MTREMEVESAEFPLRHSREQRTSRGSCLLHSSKSHFLSNCFETSHYVSLKEIQRIFDLQTKREEEKYSIL